MLGDAFPVGLYKRQEARAERLEDHADMDSRRTILRLGFVVEAVEILDDILVSWVLVNRVDKAQDTNFVACSGDITVITVSERLANSDKPRTSLRT